jgi:hypothetical protein
MRTDLHTRLFLTKLEINETQRREVETPGEQQEMRNDSRTALSALASQHTMLLTVTWVRECFH